MGRLAGAVALALLLALASDRASVAAEAGTLPWRLIAPGFEVAELPVMEGGDAVDRLYLARIEPARYRFVVRTAPAGDKDLDAWMGALGAALVVNGSYYAPDFRPVTPIVSAGTLLGPQNYNARGGAFIASPGFTGVRDLADQDWKRAFRHADDAMVSFPLLVAAGKIRVGAASPRSANRSFVGQDDRGRVIVGTTTDVLFSLDRLAQFLLGAPLGLAIALNLDGGPLANQGISLNGYERRIYGRRGPRIAGDKTHDPIPLPIVLAVLPK